MRKYKPGDRVERNCKKCHNKFIAIANRHKPGMDGGWYYKSENGKFLQTTNICHACQLSPLENVQEPRYKKARWSENIVAEYFKNKGYSVEKTKSHGPDITATKGHIVITIEVKSVSKVKNSYLVSSVTAKRKCDDLVAIVFENGSFWIEAMEYHLKKCCASGSRRVTDLATLVLKE